MRFAKGHGTGNDFLILPDPAGELSLSPALVAALCDRRTGLGADGVLRALRTEALGPVAGDARQPARADGAQWFMDYRNADGSVAEMCGNGIRVFARYLLDRGLAEGPSLAVATRAGIRQVRAEPGGEITADLGPWSVLGPAVAIIGGISCPGLGIVVGNPHLACLVDRPVAGFDLSVPPRLADEMFPCGANVEIARVTGERKLEMRVHERGSGLTRSCGTGAVAAAAAAAVAAAERGAPDGSAAGVPVPDAAWTVDVPGGRLTVTLSGTASLLTGPAVIVAEGELDAAWVAAQGGTASGAA